jgi:hypothetical protein
MNADLIEIFAEGLYRNYERTVDLKDRVWKKLDSTQRDEYRAQAKNILLFLESSMPTFEEVWAKKEAEGYQYGHDALEGVRFGWNLYAACMRGEFG